MKLSKKYFLVLFLSLFTTLSIGQTTREEFDYCTKGIKTQIENGLDVTKRGYTLDTLGKEKFTYNGFVNPVVITFLGLRSTSTKKIKAICMVYENNRNNTLIQREFFCIPTKDAK